MTSPQLKPDSGLADGLTRLRNAIELAAILAAEVERGHAQFPLRDHFRAIAADEAAAVLSVVLIATDPASRSAAFGWLFRGSHSEVRTKVPAQPFGADSIDRGLGIVSPGADDLVGTNVAEPVRVQGVEVVITDTAAIAAESSSRLDVISARLGLLVFACPASVTRGPDGVVAELADRALAAFVVLSAPVDPGSDDSTWAGTFAGGGAQIVRLGTGGLEPPSPIARGSDLRLRLSGLWLAGRLESSLALLEDRLAQERRQQDGRRRVLARRATVLADPATGRGPAESTAAVRRLLDDGIGRLEALLGERVRERSQSASARANQIRNLLEDLTSEDLVEETTGRTATIGVSPGYLARAVQTLREMVREDVSGDRAVLAEGQKALTSAVSAALDRPAGIATALCSPDPAPDATEELARAVHIDFDSRAEVPHRGLADLISHGRRPIIMLTMTLSLIGSAFGTGGGLAGRIAPALLVVFAGAVAWSVREFRQDRRERIEKELHRLRQALAGELRRLYELVLRDWQGRAGQHLRDAHRSLTQQAEERLRAWADELTRGTARERTEVQDKLRAIDLRLRELAGYEQQLQRIAQTTAEAARLLSRSASVADLVRARGV